MAGIDSYTKLMLHMDGANDSTTFVDSSLSGHEITAIGAAKISTVQSKFGGASVSLDGVDSYISIPYSDDFHFGSGDFTIETWVMFNSLPSQENGDEWPLYDQKSTPYQLGLFLGASGDGGHYLLFYGYTNVYFSVSKQLSDPLEIGVWYHISFVRHGNVFTHRLNGITVDSPKTQEIAFDILDSQIWIGRDRHDYYTDAFFDEYRVSKGIARWTSDFTPPTSAYSIDTIDTIVTTAPIANITISGAVDTIGDVLSYFLNPDTASIAISSTASTRLIKTNQFTVTYRCVLTGSADGLSDVIIPISSFQSSKTVV